MAKVGDLSLRVAIQRAFEDYSNVIFLNDNYLAFPQDLLEPISQIVRQSGHVVKIQKGYEENETTRN